MNEPLKMVSWEAPEHHHLEKTSNWYWILIIIAISGFITFIILNNILLGVLFLIAGSVMILVSVQNPRTIPFAVTLRGVRVNDELFPYSTLESFYLDEEHPHGPQLLIQSKHTFMSLIILPVPEEIVDDVDDIISARLPEEHLEEPLSHKILEFLGF